MIKRLFDIDVVRTSAGNLTLAEACIHYEVQYEL